MKLFTRVLDWYFRTHKGNEYIKKETLQNEFLKLIHNTEKRVSDEKAKEIEDLKSEYETDKLITGEDFRAEITRLKRLLADQEENAKKIEQLHYTTVRRAKMNVRISADMAYQVGRLKDIVASIAGMLEGIEERATEHLVSIEDSESQDRRRIRAAKRIGMENNGSEKKYKK